MTEVLIIPVGQGESYTVGSVGEAMQKLGVSYHILHTAIEHGTEITSHGEKFYVDIDIDSHDARVAEPIIRYELVSGDKVYAFSSYVDIAKFCKRSHRTVKKVLQENIRYIQNRITGEKFALRILKNDEG